MGWCKNKLWFFFLACPQTQGSGRGWRFREGLGRSRGRTRPGWRELSYPAGSKLFLSRWQLEMNRSRAEIPFGCEVKAWLGDVVPVQAACIPELRDAAAVLQVLLNHCGRIDAAIWIIKPRSAESNDGEGELENPVLWITSALGLMVSARCNKIKRLQPAEKETLTWFREWWAC